MKILDKNYSTTEKLIHLLDWQSTDGGEVWTVYARFSFTSWFCKS